jgi:predicted DNA-binding protein (UPF0251 family)
LADPRRFDWLFRPHPPDEDAPLSAEARFADALAQLPADERSALALSELGGLEADEIARRLGTDRETAERLVSHARARVRATLAEKGRKFLSGLLPMGAAARTLGAVAVGTVGIGATADADRAQAPDRVAPPALAVAAPAAPSAVPAARIHAAATAPALRVAASTTERRAVARRHAAPEPEPPGASRPEPGLALPPVAGPASGSASEVDRAPSLGLVRVVAVPGRQVRPQDVAGAVLHLPDVAQLVRDEVVGRVGAAKEDRPDERVAVIAAQAGEAEEPRGVDDANALDPDGPRVVVEAVEPRLGADEPLVRAIASRPKVG